MISNPRSVRGLLCYSDTAITSSDCKGNRQSVPMQTKSPGHQTGALSLLGLLQSLPQLCELTSPSFPVLLGIQPRVAGFVDFLQFGSEEFAEKPSLFLTEFNTSVGHWLSSASSSVSRD
jgi:hypothetical protein